MSYTEINFTIDPREPGSEIIVAQLAEIGYESFEETVAGVKAYIPSHAYDESGIAKLDIFQLGWFKIKYTTQEIKEENWNAVWESAYEPVNIKDVVYVKASFHPDLLTAKYQILIDPKMSFGTAHHETTSLMIEAMLREDINDLEILDMGCGTAVLAILAEQLGAKKVVAIDNDANAVDNARENVGKNNCTHTSVHLGAAERIKGQFNLILANINKNILIRDLHTYASHMKKNGIILLSGFYHDDLEELRMYAQESGLSFDNAEIKNKWVVARFIKQ